MDDRFDTPWGVGMQRAYVEKHDTPNSPHKEHMAGVKGGGMKPEIQQQVDRMRDFVENPDLGPTKQGWVPVYREELEKFDRHAGSKEQEAAEGLAEIAGNTSAYHRIQQINQFSEALQGFMESGDTEATATELAEIAGNTSREHRTQQVADFKQHLDELRGGEQGASHPRWKEDIPQSEQDDQERALAERREGEESAEARRMGQHGAASAEDLPPLGEPSEEAQRASRAAENYGRGLRGVHEARRRAGEKTGVGGQKFEEPENKSFPTPWGVGMQRSFIEKHDTPQSPHKEHMGSGGQGETGPSPELQEDMSEYVSRSGGVSMEDEDRVVNDFLAEAGYGGAEDVNDADVREAFRMAVEDSDDWGSLPSADPEAAQREWGSLPGGGQAHVSNPDFNEQPGGSEGDPDDQGSGPDEYPET